MEETVSEFDFSSFSTLVVEDSDFVRHVVKKYLTEMGFREVHEASNGMEGISMLQHRPDIIVCDIEMEPLNGFEFLKLLRKQPGGEKLTPVAFLTCSAEADYVHQAMQLGVNAYLLKPVRPDALRRKLTELMNRMLTA
jgi:two-component system, chemotaxis family, chemotaxis protein CheY